MTKKGTEGMNKRVQKNVCKPALKDETPEKTPTAGAIPLPKTTDAANDGDGWALVPLEARSPDWLRGILTGNGVHFARRIVTEAGEDWRTFEETVRAILSGEIVPPTLAEVRAWWEREKQIDLPSLEEMETMTEYELSNRLKIFDKRKSQNKRPESWSKLSNSCTNTCFYVYGWFYQLAGDKGRKGADAAPLAKIVEDAAPLFADYSAESVREKIRRKAFERECDLLRNLRDSAETKEEWEKYDEELSDHYSKNDPYGFPGETLCDGLYSRAMDYLQRRVAALLPAASDGRPVPLSPELAELRHIRESADDAATILLFLLNKKNRREAALACARIAAMLALKRPDKERIDLSRALDEVQRLVDTGKTDSSALEIVARNCPVPSQRARSGFLSKEGLKGAWKQYKANKRKREAEAKREADARTGAALRSTR